MFEFLKLTKAFAEVRVAIEKRDLDTIQAAIQKVCDLVGIGRESGLVNAVIDDVQKKHWSDMWRSLGELFLEIGEIVAGAQVFRGTEVDGEVVAHPDPSAPHRLAIVSECFRLSNECVYLSDEEDDDEEDSE